MKNRIFIICCMCLLAFSCKSKKESTQTKSVQKEEAKVKTTPIKEELTVQSPDETAESKRLISNVKAHLNDSIVLRIQKTACFGRCPIYTASIYPSGRVDYLGEKWVENEGNFMGRMNQEDLQMILDKAEAIEYFSLNTFYDSKNITDLPSTILSIRNEEEVKIVVNRYQAPEALLELTLLIEQKIAKVELKPGPLE